MAGQRLDRRSFLGAAAAALTPRTATGAAPAAASEGTREQTVVATARDSRFDPWIEVRADHLLQNVAEVARFAGDRPVMAVIKNNAYGLGLTAVAETLARAKAVRSLAVVKLKEAFALRDAGIEMPILMMGPFDAGDVAEMHARDIMPMVYTPIGDALARAAAGGRKPLTIHVKVDTGLGRVGVPYRQALELVRDLAQHKGIVIGGLMTTLSEDPALDQDQLRRLRELDAALEKSGVDAGLLHAASSYSLFQHDNALLDMVRPGMVLYGIYPAAGFRKLKRMTLRPAVALRTRVIYTKQLAAGESAGYERAFVARRPTWIATLPIGHADGWPRVAAKGARVRIGRRRYPVIASVSASHTLLDIGPEPTVQVGDIATLFDWEEGSRPEDVAAACGASVYDLTMHLGGHLARRLV
jgi:alanine racemase